MKDECSEELINNNFARHLITLASDPVPNIRFNVSKTIGELYTSLSPDNIHHCRETLERIAENDSDFDSKYYAQKSLEKMAGQGDAGH